MAYYRKDDDIYRKPELGQPITKTTGTLDMSEELAKFRKVFQCEFYPGYRYRKIEPIHTWTSSNMVDMRTHDEPGFLIALSETHMRELVKCGLEGESHRKFREENPAAMAAWEEYMTIYSLTRNYED